MFVNSVGRLLDNSGFRRNVFDRAVEVLGLNPFTPHNLRDSAATLAVSAGANVKVVQRMLGHASAAMTLDVYSGLFTEDLDEVAVRLNEGARSAAHHSRTRVREQSVLPLRHTVADVGSV